MVYKTKTATQLAGRVQAWNLVALFVKHPARQRLAHGTSLRIKQAWPNLDSVKRRRLYLDHTRGIATEVLVRPRIDKTVVASHSIGKHIRVHESQLVSQLL